MLYTISINQESAILSGLPLKFQHLAVIAVLKNMFSSPEIEETWHDGKSYKWIAIQVICDELPILDLEKRRVSALLSELESMNVIMRHPQNQKLRKSFFRAGNAWSNLFSSMQKNADTSMQKNAEVYAKKCIDTMQKNADNHNTNNHYTTNHINSERDFSEKENEPHPSVKANREKVMNAETQEKPPFESATFLAVWKNWKTHLSSKGKRVTTMQMEAQGIHLHQLVNGNEKKAIDCIMQSIRKGWADLFPIDENKTDTRGARNQEPKKEPEYDPRVKAVYDSKGNFLYTQRS